MRTEHSSTFAKISQALPDAARIALRNRAGEIRGLKLTGNKTEYLLWKHFFDRLLVSEEATPTAEELAQHTIAAVKCLETQATNIQSSLTRAFETNSPVDETDENYLYVLLFFLLHQRGIGDWNFSTQRNPNNGPTIRVTWKDEVPPSQFDEQLLERLIQNVSRLQAKSL